MLTFIGRVKVKAKVGQDTMLCADIDGSLIQNYWGSSGTANASFTAAVSASSPWCMQRCSNSDCGDASLDAVIVVSSICDERLGQMWYNDTSMIRSRLTDECLTICGLSAADASASSSGSGSSTADTCLGAGSDYCSHGVQRFGALVRVSAAAWV